MKRTKWSKDHKKVPWNKGISRTPEEKRKMSESKKGQIPWNKGKKMPSHVGQKIAEANRNRIWKDETRKKMSNSRKGRKFTKEHSKNISEGLKGHEVNEETKIKIAESVKNYYEDNKHVIKGRTQPESVKRKIALKAKGRLSPNKGKYGKLNPNWRGGSSSYDLEWTDTLKEKIKTRDAYQCQNPGCNSMDRLCVHHINYDKKDCREENLITLCITCNLRANGNRRLWFLFYKTMMEGILCKKRTMKVM